MIMINKITVKVPLHTVKVYRGNRGAAPFILNLGNKWWRMMIVTEIKVLSSPGLP
jgi:hypothetical protein